MSICFLLLSVQVGWANIAKLEPVVTLAPLPEDSDWFLQAPSQVAIDDQGRYFVLDVESYSVFVWQKDGNFLEQFGKQGQGPGEFVFSGRRGRARGYIAIQNDKIYVCDPAKREVLMFATKDFGYLGAFSFQIPRGRVEYYQTLPNDQFLLRYRTFSEEGITRHIGIFGKDGKEVSKLQSYKDESFSMKGGSGRGRRTFTITAFSASPVVSFNSQKSQIIIGHSEQPLFGVFDTSGKKLKTVKFAMPKQEVSAEDKNEFNEQPFIKNSTRVTASFPDHKAYYDQVLPIKGGGYLVFHRSPFYRTMNGLVLDSDGKVKAKFSLACGENGDLLETSGRLFGIITDDEGEFSLQELRVVEKSQS